MKAPNWTPTGWTVLIDPEYSKTMDWGNGLKFEIVEPDRQGIAAVTKGQVVAMGKDCYRGSRFSEPWCKVGDVVIYARYGGVIIEDPETKKKYVLLNDEDIKGVVNERTN